MSEIKICLRCGKEYTEYPALSRVDNKSEICSGCGTEESLMEFAFLSIPNSTDKVKKLDNTLNILTLVMVKLPKDSLKYKHYKKIKDQLMEKI